MKQTVIGMCVVLVVAAVSLLPGRAQDAAATATSASEQPPTHNWAAGNPLKIALLHWYQANTTTSFSVGKTENSNPYGIAFDGANIWTANSEGTVTKLRASDGKILGNFKVPGSPNFLVFDGANIWVTSSPNTVSKLRASNRESERTESADKRTRSFREARGGGFRNPGSQLPNSFMLSFSASTLGSGLEGGVLHGR